MLGAAGVTIVEVRKLLREALVFGLNRGRLEIQDKPEDDHTTE